MKKFLSPDAPGRYRHPSR